MIKKLLPYMADVKKVAIITPLLVAGEVVMEVLIPLLMAKIVDVGMPAKDMGYVLRLGGLMILMTLFSLFFGAMAGRTAALASTGFAKSLRNALFSKVQTFAFSNIDRFSTASLITRLTTDVTNTQNITQMALRILVRAPFMLICAIGMALYINARLTRVFLLAALVLAVGIVLIMRTAFPLFFKMMEAYDKLNIRTQENLTAIRTVKAFVREPHESEAFRQAADRLRTTQLKAEKVVIFAMPLQTFVLYACIVAVCWFGGNYVIGGSMDTGELISFVTYTSQIMISLMMVAMIMLSLVLSRASAVRILEVLDEEPAIKNPENAADRKSCAGIPVKDGSVRFENVSLHYGEASDRQVLKNISFSIASGETVGILGGTGSAKSTLVQLIPRLYEPQDGAVYVGGENVKDYDLHTLRDNVAMVLQKNLLFSGTIEENLRWGNPEATEEELWEACRAACAEEFIRRLPDGLQTDLGQGGSTVSGGQRQRLCIARALLKKPKILILDDSMSAVDTATEASIRQSLRTMRADMTTFIIAQRISSLQDADRILVMDYGRIDGIGTHEELIQTNEIYKDIYRIQVEQKEAM